MEFDSFQWQQGTWCPVADANIEAQLIITSDWAPIRAFGPIIANNPLAVYGDVIDVLRQGDLCVTNLESPLSDRGVPVSKSGSVFKGLSAHIKGLSEVPFGVVTLGNNHVFDYGLDAFYDTLDLMKTNGIGTVGAGETPESAHQPLTIDVKGIRVGIVNFSEGEDQTTAVDGPGVFGWDVDRVVQQVQTLRSSADIVLVISHCGVEYIPVPPPYVASAFERIASAGADLVIGHHPHVPQGIRIVNNTPICYSLGNFVFYQETDLLFRKIGYLVKVGLSEKSIARMEIVPYRIQPDCLSLLKGDEKTWFFNVLKEISAPLTGPNTIEAAWHGFLCRYGVRGFKDEIQMILDQLTKNPRKGAAMFRNRIATMQHRQHWMDAMTRIIEGRLDKCPGWASELVERWGTRKIDDNW